MTTSRRLTSMLRARILKNLLAHRFGAEEEVLSARLREVARRIYDDAFTEDQRALMASLPTGWLPTSTHVHAQLAGTYQSLCLGEERPFPDEHNNQCLVYDGGHPIAEQWSNVSGLLEAIRQEKRQASRAAEAVMDQATMTGALVARWPEVAPFVPGEEPAAILPALLTSQVNALLGLPAKTAVTSDEAA